MKPKKSAKKEQGFSLTEVSVAAGIVSFSLLPLVGMLGIVSTQQKSTLDEASALSFVESISQTLSRNNSEISRFIWHMTDGEKVIFDYPVSGNSSEVYLKGDIRGNITGSVTSQDFRNGLPSAGLDDAALIRVTMKDHQCGVSGSLTSQSSVSLEVVVETPVGASEENRDSEVFRTVFQ